MTQMMALRQFTYAGKKLLPGSEFQVSLNRDVRILSVLRYATISIVKKVSVEEAESKPPAPELELDPQPEKESEFAPEDAPPKKRRRYYRRRDMKAEDD